MSRRFTRRSLLAAALIATVVAPTGAALASTCARVREPQPASSTKAERLAAEYEKGLVSVEQFRAEYTSLRMRVTRLGQGSSKTFEQYLGEQLGNPLKSYPLVPLNEGVVPPVPLPPRMTPFVAWRFDFDGKPYGAWAYLESEWEREDPRLVGSFHAIEHWRALAHMPNSAPYIDPPPGLRLFFGEIDQNGQGCCSEQVPV